MNNYENEIEIERLKNDVSILKDEIKKLKQKIHEIIFDGSNDYRGNCND